MKKLKEIYFGKHAFGPVQLAYWLVTLIVLGVIANMIW